MASQILKLLAQLFPPIRRLVNERDMLKSNLAMLQKTVDALSGDPSVKPFLTFAYPGHFYSPIPSLDEIKANEQRIWAEPGPSLPAIDLNAGGQLALLQEFTRYYPELPFQDERSRRLRYSFDNPAFGCGDAVALYSIMRHFKPRRIIEVGSGYSSCVMLDVNQLFFDGSIQTTFIEPYPELLLSLIKPEDRKSIRLIPSRLQDTPLETFDTLESSDILFIDSTHVSKVGSDVNTIFFELLPRLKPGVLVHIHDILYPFEYPLRWLEQGTAWNEDYLLRAFLEYNQAFRIIFFNQYLSQEHRSQLFSKLPLFMKDDGASFWMQKVA